ncbi:MAG: ArsR family transcriptional regulator [Jatrophihabitans sp.]|nr:MAG: ArsR family transcriptional regulator [Jatrophihabitans sp.]
MPLPRPTGPRRRKTPPREPVEPVDFDEAADTFALLAAPTRVRLLWLLAQHELDVSSLAEAVDATVPTVSQHLAKLRLADLVTARAEGRRQIYRVEDRHIVELVTQAVHHHAEIRSRGTRLRGS